MDVDSKPLSTVSSITFMLNNNTIHILKKVDNTITLTNKTGILNLKLYIFIFCPHHYYIH